jgi:hydrogenase maturation protease
MSIVQSPATTRSTVLLVGLGSPHGDDRAGWHAAGALASPSVGGLCVRTASSPIEILDWLDGQRRLIVCDAAVGTGRAGELARWTWPDQRLAALSFRGTHDLPLVAVLELAGRLGRLPPEVVVWTIEAQSVEAGAELSPDVESALPTLVARLRGELCDA